MENGEEIDLNELDKTTLNQIHFSNPYKYHIALVNPIRYRGYYYDSEIGLYYLQSRYYDPQIGRFINADALNYLDPENIGGLNLYTYCNNNPIMYTDSTGTSWWSDFWNSTFGKVLGTILVVGAVIALSILTAGIGTAITTAIGGFAGAVIGGAVGGAISGAIFSAGFSIGSQGIIDGYGNVNWQDVGKATLIGAATGALFGGAIGGLKHVAQGGLKVAQAGYDKAAKALSKTYRYINGNKIANITALQAYSFADKSLKIAQNIVKITDIASLALKLGRMGLNSVFNALWN